MEPSPTLAADPQQRRSLLLNSARVIYSAKYQPAAIPGDPAATAVARVALSPHTENHQLSLKRKYVEKFLYWLESKLKHKDSILKNMTENNHITLTETSICSVRVHQ